MNVKKRAAARVGLCLLAMLLLVSCLAGCGAKKGKTADGTKTGGETVTKAPENTAIKDDLPDVDMDGFEFVVLNYTDAGHGYSYKTVVLEAGEIADGDVVGEKIYSRNMKIEDRFKCLISEHQEDQPNVRLKNAVMENSNEYHIALMYEEDRINDVLVNGAIRLFDEIPYIDLSRPYWNDSAADAYSYKGYVYAGVGDWCLSMYSKLHAYLVNKQVYNSVAQEEDLYDLVRNKEWTLEKMFEIAQRYDRIADGAPESNQYGLIGTSKVHYQLLLTGAGLKYVNNTEDGYAFSLGDPNNTPVLDNILRLSSQYFYKNTPGHNDGIVTDEFIQGRAMMMAGMIITLDAVRGEVQNVGVLPAPLYNEEQDDYHTISVGGLVTCFPLTLSDADLNNAGIIAEALCCESYNSVIPEYKEVLLKSRRTDSPDDAEMMDVLFRTMSFDLGCSTWGYQIRLNLMSNVFNYACNNTASPAVGPIPPYASVFATLNLEEDFQKTMDGVIARVWKMNGDGAAS